MPFYFPEFRFPASPGEVLVNVAIAVAGRVLDLWSTFYVTRQMMLETNRRVQKAGWRGAILLQIPAIVVAAFNLYIAFFIFLWSLFVAAANLEGSYYIRDKGEEAYRKELQEMVKRTPWRKLVLGESHMLGSMVVAGGILITFVIIEDSFGIVMVAIALICHGLLKTVRSLQYLKRLRALPIAEKEKGEVASASDLNRGAPPEEDTGGAPAAGNHNSAGNIGEDSHGPN